jgi:hypothetical protein
MVRLTHIRPAAATKIYAKAILPVTPQPDFRNPWGEQLRQKRQKSRHAKTVNFFFLVNLKREKILL